MKSKLRWLKKLWDEFSGISAGTQASSIAYFAFLSLIPLLTLIISIVTMTGLGEREVVGFFSIIAPDTFEEFARTLIADAYKKSGVAFSLSTLTLIWSASQGIRALHDSLNTAYGVKEQRSFLVIIATCIGAVIILGILLAATIYLVFGGPVMRAIAWIAPGLSQHENTLNILSAVVMAVTGTVALALCYTFLPAEPRRFTAQLPGAALASLSCGVLTIGFHVYVNNFCNFELLYGSIATIALFLFWLFLVSYIVIAGAFVNRTLANDRAHGK